jgi:MoxR-like ATPase
VILIDEIDKGDLDFPNDLLNILEDGEFTIPELVRYEKADAVTVRTDDQSGLTTIEHGRVVCSEFPLVFITNNGEREFAPAFLRRCLRLEMGQPDAERLAQLVTCHMGDQVNSDTVVRLIEDFVADSEGVRRAPDQLLNAVFVIARNSMSMEERRALEEQLLRPIQM